jgi:hypothetical protein
MPIIDFPRLVHYIVLSSIQFFMVMKTTLGKKNELRVEEKNILYHSK